MFPLLGIVGVFDVVKVRLLILIHKLYYGIIQLNNIMLVKNDRSYQFRTGELCLCLPKCRTNYGLHSIVYKGSKL